MTIYVSYALKTLCKLHCLFDVQYYRRMNLKSRKTSVSCCILYLRAGKNHEIPRYNGPYFVFESRIEKWKAQLHVGSFMLDSVGSIIQILLSKC